MKKQLILYSIILLVFSLGCNMESEMDKAWKNIGVEMVEERLEPQIKDTLNALSQRTPFDVGNDVVDLFKDQKTSYQDSTALNLSALKTNLLQIEGVPDTCKNVISTILSEDNIKSTSSFHLDSARTIILDCLFTELLEKKFDANPQN